MRNWDSFDVYLFDIDGTLLRCDDAVHYFAFCSALESIAGRPLNLDGVTAHGNTDVGILRDAFALAKVPEHHWRPRLAEVQESMSSLVERRQAEICATVMPGVHQLLQFLSSRGAILGVATGNLSRIGKIKLERAGLLHYFQLCGWSDRFEYRADVIRAAIDEARQIAGPQASICMVGDTPADIQAARANQLPVIAVATGIYSFDELASVAPDICLNTFDDLLCTLEQH